MNKTKFINIKILLKALVGVLLLVTMVMITIIHVLGNFYQVDEDVFRSGQLNKYNLEYYAKKHNIKTIINLRGKSKRTVYDDEVEISNKLDIRLVNYGISNRKFLDFNKTRTIVQMLKDADKPLLIHCAGGADRTSLASALYQYSIAKKSEEVSRKQFSIIYGHTPFFRKHVIAMDDSFDNYINKISNHKE